MLASALGGAIEPLSKADWRDDAPVGGRAASDASDDDEGETLDNTAASSRVPTPEPSPGESRMLILTGLSGQHSIFSQCQSVGQGEPRRLRCHLLPASTPLS